MQIWNNASMTQARNLGIRKVSSMRLPCVLFLGLLWIQGVVTSHLVSDSLLTKKCHQSYYIAPKCLNYTDGYGCDCGSGFHWNTEMCMSTAIDTRFEFMKRSPVRYTLLLGKAFPKLQNFTVAFWIRLFKSDHERTVLSYKHRKKLNIFRLVVRDSLWVCMRNTEIDTGLVMKNNEWYHVIWIWNSKDGSWEIYFNNKRMIHNNTGEFAEKIPSGGEFVLGQTSRAKFKFNETVALVGDLAHVNIWNQVLNSNQRRIVAEPCKFMYCGNVVQWADFRSGTRGAMRMRWPSGIEERPCYTSAEVAMTCNKYCSDVIGAQCNKETVENIVWVRTPAVSNLSVPCPGQEMNAVNNETYDTATRSCYTTEQNDGYWGVPVIDDCISQDLKDLKQEMLAYFSGDMAEEKEVIDFANLLLNHTQSNAYTNPIDIATVIDLLESVVDTQSSVTVIDVNTISEGRRVYKRAHENAPTIEQTKLFAGVIVDIVNQLLDGKNEVAWSKIKPPGVEADNLLQTMEKFSKMVAKNLQQHVQDQTVSVTDATVIVYKDHIDFKTEVVRRESFFGYTYPGTADRREYGLTTFLGKLELADDLFRADNTSGSELIQICSFRYRDLAKHLPNHDTKSKSKEDNVNTPILALYIYSDQEEVFSNLSSPIMYSVPYLDTFNISNPECVSVTHAHTNGSTKKPWNWAREGCNLIWTNEMEGICGCIFPGVFAITTDMYNVNWDRGEKIPILMNAASYIGCALSALMCITTVVVHVKFRSSSSTASLHKNLAVSIILSQAVFMGGIERYNYPIVCHAFAVLLHYFFLATYSWLMNEAFNQYIVITYSAHSHGELSDSGSMFRYYVLGWVMPGVLVAAFVGSEGEGYYAKDMCWVAWENLWLFVGPALGIIAVTIMVLTFTAKEHNENSYTKSEKTNKIILIHMKGLWTQIILVSVAWAFAFLSLKMHDSIIKYLYALMNILQGAFFVVFFLFLHEEIQTVLQRRRKKKPLFTQFDIDQEEHSTDSVITSSIHEKDCTSDTVPLQKPSKEVEKVAVKSGIEASIDDRGGSDCEMITTV